MAKVKRGNQDANLVLECDNPSDKFSVVYTNMGEPFREGIQISVDNDDTNEYASVMLCDYEAKQLRDMLISRYPID